MRFDRARFAVHHGQTAWLTNGAARGELDSPRGKLGWELRFIPAEQSFRLLHSERLLRLLSKTRFISPNGQVLADGRIWIGDQQIPLQAAPLTQGHMYGSFMHPSWVWGSCPRFDDAPDCAFQGVASRKAGQVLMSFELVLDGQRHVFNRLQHLRGRGLGLLSPGTRAEFALGRWDFSAVHDGLAVEGEYRAPREGMHRVRYRNVDGLDRFNCSQLRGSLRLQVRSADGQWRELVCAGRAPLEFVDSTPPLGIAEDYRPSFAEPLASA